MKKVINKIFLMQNNDEIHIILGTKSQIKLQALNEVIKDSLVNKIVKVFTYDVPSGVPDQPFNEEGRIGASQRAMNAAKEYQKQNFFNTKQAISIGIENYVETTMNSKSGKVYNDIAAISVITLPNSSNEQPIIVYSDPLEFTAEYVEEAILLNTTVGKVMKDKGVVKNANDPHLELSGKSRVEFLKKPLKEALTKVLLI
jgi:non-canonical (house-cleaning) NTP pyrophosphatase